MLPALKIKYAEACFYLKNEPKFAGVSGLVTRTTTAPVSPPSAADTIPPVTTTFPIRSAAVFVRPVGVKKMKKLQVMESNRETSNRMPIAVEGMGTALKKSAAEREKLAALKIKIRLIGKAGFPKAAMEAAYRQAALGGGASTYRCDRQKLFGKYTGRW